MTTAEKYQVVIQVLRQEREVVAGTRNPNDAEQLALMDRQIAGAEAGLQEALAGNW